MLAVTYVLGLVIGPATASVRRRQWGLGLAGAYVVLSVGLFAFFYPLYTAQVIPYSQWQRGCGSRAGSDPGQRASARKGRSRSGVVSCTTRTASCGVTSSSA